MAAWAIWVTENVVGRRLSAVGQEHVARTLLSAKSPGASRGSLFCFLGNSLPKCPAMQITYQLSEKDFVEASKTHRKRNPFGKWSKRIVSGAAMLVAVAIIFGLILQHGIQLTKDYLPFFGLVVFWFLILWAWPRWTMKQQFRKQPGAQGPRTVILDADGVHWRWDGGSADVAGKNYIRWAEGKDQILFYTSPACFNILPIQGLPPQQIIDLRELLKQNIQAVK